MCLVRCKAQSTPSVTHFIARILTFSCKVFDNIDIAINQNFMARMVKSLQLENT